MRNRNCESLQVWKIFAASSHGNRLFLHSLSLNRFQEHLVDYFTGVTSTALCWMTDVNLLDVNCSAADLKQLTSICNLQNLIIRNSSKDRQNVSFDDGVLSYLSSSASREGKLRHLETMFLFNVPGITARAFDYLDAFPALETFCTYGTRGKHSFRSHARDKGWVAEAK